MNKKLSRILQPGYSLVFLVMLFLFAGVTALTKQYYIAIAEAGVTVLLYTGYLLMTRRRKKAILKFIQNASDSLDTMSGDSLHMPMPMAVLNLGTGELLWSNEQFAELAGVRDSLFTTNITDYCPSFSTQWLTDGKPECPADLVMQGRRFRVFGMVAGTDGDAALLASTYWIDTTELLNIRDEFIRSRPVVAIILIDNYDEITNNMPDASISDLNSAINKAITAWTDGTNGLLRKLERNRYLFLFEARQLPAMQEGRFSLLESIRSVQNPGGIAATISLGIGKDGANFAENYQFATLSIEMALSRGGDQAVIKDRYNFSFYGGKTRETERRTKVRSRVMAGSLSELIRQSSYIFIMGHRNADLDALGAAVGIQCLCRKQGKKANLVFDQQKTMARALLDQLLLMPEYADCFLSEQDAMLLADAHSLLIIVDTNRPEQVESRALLDSIPRVAVIDHHRRAADYIEQVVMSLLEPYASSASELVTELLEYGVDTADILPMEAEALLAGIVLDTKNFSVRTGGRTFEAAAFLRRCGADTVEVKKLFKNDLSTTISRYQIIQKARLYRETIAIAALDYTVTRIIAAQAADELLNISGIMTSFVIFPDGERVVISARSIGDANVQMILEPLGGGGNAATAGAQVAGKSVHDVLTELVASIDAFYDS